MNKKFSRLMAVLLSISILLVFPVFASAQGDYVDISDASVNAMTGDWKNDYIGTMQIKFKCNVDSVGDSDVIFTVAENKESNVIKKIKKSDANVSISGSTVTIKCNYNAKMSHSSEYYFEIVEGALKTKDGKISASYTFSDSGNAIIETVSAEKVATTPVEKIINYLEAQNNKILYPLIWLLKWVISL